MKRIFACIGFSMAVTLLVLNLLPTGYILIIAIGLAVLFAASLLLPKYRKAVVLPLVFGSAIISALLLFYSANYVVTPQVALNGCEVPCSFYVQEQVSESDQYTTYVAKTVSINRPQAPQNILVLLTTRKSKEIIPFTIYEGNLKFTSIADDAYSSHGYYADNIYVRASVKHCMKTSKTHSTPYQYIINLRHSIVQRLYRLLEDDEGALSVALVTGNKSLLSDEADNSFRLTGTSHIMAVSGLHLSVIVGAFLYLLRLFKVKEKLRSLLSIILVIFYMTLVGFSGSITRAGIMLIVIMVGSLFSMRPDTLNSLGVAVFVMCINPYSVTDVGTVLSVLAVLSLCTLYPAIYSKMKNKYVDPLDKTKKEKRYDYLFKVMSIFYTSVAVLIFTLPVSYVYFGYASVVSPIANIVALPVGSVCVVLSFMTYIFSIIGLNPLTVIVAFATKKLEQFLLWYIGLIGGLGNVSFSFDRYFGITIAGVLILFAIAFIMRSKHALKVAGVISIAMIIIVSIFVNVYSSNYSNVYVSSNGCVVATEDDITVVWGVDNKSSYYDARNYLKSHSLSIDYLVVHSSSNYCAKLSESIPVNYVLCDTFDDIILLKSNHKNLEVQNCCNVLLDDGFNLWYNQGDITVDVNGFTISNCDETATVRLDKGKAYDRIGKIDLSKGDVLYAIKDKNTFSVRRLNQWQK